MQDKHITPVEIYRDGQLDRWETYKPVIKAKLISLGNFTRYNEWPSDDQRYNKPGAQWMRRPDQNIRSHTSHPSRAGSFVILAARCSTKRVLRDNADKRVMMRNGSGRRGQPIVFPPVSRFQARKS